MIEKVTNNVQIGNSGFAVYTILLSVLIIVTAKIFQRKLGKGQS